MFTTALFGEAVAGRRMGLDDPLRTYLPYLRLNWCTARITPRELANFSSGMPELPFNAAGRSLGDVPLAQRGIDDYTYLDFLNWVQRWKPPADGGQRCDLPADYKYSNASVGLLGFIVAQRLGVPWEEAVRGRITGPLGMTSTFLTVPPGASGRVAVGHAVDGAPAPTWPIFAWYPAGGLRSTAADMLAFGEASLGHATVNGAPTPPALIDALRQAMTTTYQPRDSDGTPLPFLQGFAWVEKPPVPEEGYAALYLKDGGTDGFSSTLVIDPAKDLAVFIAFSRYNARVQPLGVDLARQIR